MNTNLSTPIQRILKYILTLIMFQPISSFTQSIKISPFIINYPSSSSFDISACAPFKEYSIEGMNTPDGMGFTYDYYDESINQFKTLLSSLLKSEQALDCKGLSNIPPKYKIECRLESRSEGKVVTSFSSISLEITMTWKMTRLDDGEVIFREKAIGLHKNKIGNAFSGKANAKERASKALEMAFLESRKILEMKLGEIK